MYPQAAVTGRTDADLGYHGPELHHAILPALSRRRPGQAMRPQVTHLFLKPTHGAPMEPQAFLRAVAGKGLSGDAAFGTSRRQVLVMDLETLAEFALNPGDIRENIVTSGLPLADLRTGDRIRIDDVVLEISGQCTPCDYLETLRPGLREGLAGRRGMLARVAAGGRIAVGAQVQMGSSSGR